MAIRNEFLALDTYRFFAVNRNDVVLWDRHMQCVDDCDAEAMAETLSSVDVGIEVWDVARFVARSAAQ